MRMPFLAKASAVEHCQTSPAPCNAPEWNQARSCGSSCATQPNLSLASRTNLALARPRHSVAAVATTHLGCGSS